jgi:hypothetical protein
MKATDFEELLKWGAILGGVYLVYQIMQKIGAVGQTAAEIGSEVNELADTTADPAGVTWAAWYDPTQRNVFFYILTFPDGNHHMVWSSSVQTNGTFVWNDGQTYRIGRDKAGGLRSYLYQPPLGQLVW